MKSFLVKSWKAHRIAFILVMAFSLRITFAVCSTIPIMSDSLDFQLVATNLLNGKGFTLNNVTTAYRLPGYPYFLALLWNCNNSVFFVQLVQSVGDTLSCYLIYRLGSLCNENTGLYGATVWALFPSAIVLSSLLLTETLFTSILLYVTLLIIKKNTRVADTLMIGIISAIAILMKPHFILLLGSLLCWKILMVEKRTKEFIRFTTIGIILILSISPWSIRNHENFGTYSLSTNGGVNFWIGNNHNATGGYYFIDGNEVDSIQNEVGKNSKGYELGLQFIKNEPIRAAMLIPKKLAHLFSSQNYIYKLIFDSSKFTYRQVLLKRSFFELIYFNLIFVLIVIGGAAGLTLMLRIDKTTGRIYYSMILMWLVFHLIYFGGARFLFPILPFFAIGYGFFFSTHSSYRFTMWERIFLVLFSVGFLSVLTTEMIIVFY
jgi:hypothetical protein